MNASHLMHIDSVWMIDDRFASHALRAIESIDYAAHLKEYRLMIESRQPSNGSALPTPGMDYQVDDDGIAEIAISGPLTKQPNSMQSMFGGTSTVLARRTLRQAKEDPECKGVLLRWETPGGQSAGMPEFFAEIAALAAAKPTWSFCEDVCCSAGFMGACGADKVFCNASALMGNIGTYQVLTDSSGAAQADGVKVHVVKNKGGKFKGVGVPGSQITDEQLEEQQRIIEAINDGFVSAVSSGRKMPLDKAQALADGRVYVGKEALAAGLVDGVDTYENVRANLAALVAPTSPNARPDLKPKPGARAEKESAMEKNPTAGANPASNEPKPATIAELKSAFPKDPAFVLECAEKALTLTESRAAYGDVLSKRLADAESKLAEKPPVQGKKPGGPGVTEQSATETADAGDAVSQWKAAAQKHVDAGLPLSKANARVVREQPQLHRAYLEASNSNPTRKLALQNYLDAMTGENK